MQSPKLWFRTDPIPEYHHAVDHGDQQHDPAAGVHTASNSNDAPPDIASALGRFVRKRRPHRVRSGLALLVLACVLPIWAAAGILLYYAYESKRDLIEGRMVDTARALSLVVDWELTDTRTTLEALATSPALASGDLAAFHRQARDILKEFPGADIVLANASGKQLVNTYRPFGTSLPNRNAPDMVRRVYETGRPAISSLFWGAVTGRPLISVDVPVFREGQVVYDLAMTEPAEHLGSALTQEHLPPTWIGTVLDKNETIVVQTRASEKFIGRQVRPPLLRAMTEAAEGTAEVRNLENVPMFDSFSRSASSGWTVIIGMPREVMTAEIWRWLRWTIAGTALLSIAGIGLALLMARTIADSIQALIAPALELGSGRPVVIGDLDLAEARDVGQSLVKASELLQQRAAERERAEEVRRHAEELQRSNAELERTSNEERARAADLSAILDAVPGVTFIAHDRECRRITINRTGRELLRLPPGDISGITGSTNFRAFKDGRELSAEELPLQRAAATGKEIRNFEFTLIFNDGSSQDLFGHAVPLLDVAGEVQGVVGSFVDITERKQAREALRQSEEQFRTLTETIPQLCWMADSSGNYRFLSKRWEEYTGIPIPHLLGSGWRETVYPQDNDRFQSAWTKATAEGIPFEVECRLRNASGHYEWFLVRAIKLADSNLWSGANTNIDEIKRGEQALIQSEKLASVGRMAATIAHEINNPLEAAMNAVFLAATTAGLPEAAASKLDLVERELERVAHLAKQTLGFYRETGSPVAVHLSEVVDNVLDLYEPKLRNKSASVLRRYKSRESVHANEGEVRQIISNLVANSVDAIGPNGTLFVRTAFRFRPGQERPMVNLTIADTGAGIAAENLKHIFDAFFTTKQSIGTGLGLWVTRELIRKHEGKIYVRSRLGKGTVFVVSLPAERRNQHRNSDQAQEQ